MVEHLLRCLRGNGFKAGPGFHLLLTYMQPNAAEKKHSAAPPGKKKESCHLPIEPGKPF